MSHETAKCQAEAPSVKSKKKRLANYTLIDTGDLYGTAGSTQFDLPKMIRE